MKLRNSIPLFVLLSMTALAADAPKSNDQKVRDFISAFNSREIDTMMAMVSDDIQWLSVAGDKIAVETQGKSALRDSLTSYFTSMPSAKSALEWVQASESRVAALEKASWTSKSGAKSQSSLAVYEFSDGLIVRVYYYPAEK